jgi:hypothetical protein
MQSPSNGQVNGQMKHCIIRIDALDTATVRLLVSVFGRTGPFLGRRVRTKACVESAIFVVHAMVWFHHEGNHN